MEINQLDEAAKEWLFLIVAALIDSSMFEIKIVGRDKEIEFTLYLQDEHKGRIIGKNGKHIEAIRMLLYTVGRNYNRTYIININANRKTGQV